jgi:SAM-dependent methyltransferase
MGLKRAAATVSVALACTGAASQEEVPFIMTPDAVTMAMLELASVGAADHLIDLGSGDGRIVITAARRFGASGLGVEIVPALVERSRANARRAGVEARVQFREQDLFATDLSRASVVTMYLLPEVNLQLRPRLLALAPGTRIVSHDWDLGDWEPDRSLTLAVPDKAIGREKQSRVHLWTVPAAVQGTWCTAGARLELTQRFQQFSAALYTAAQPAVPALVFDGRIAGRTLDLRAPHDGRFQREDGGLRTSRFGGAGAAWSGRLFTPAPAGGCA